MNNRIDIEKIKSIEKSIPIQIQKLFSQLQMKKEKRINTQDLIKSFGWNSGEAFQQHDSQEFIRILFEAIDNTFKEKFINDLYQGQMMNYVKCLNCSNESLREESFLDIQLTIQNDFENIKNESIHEAFVNLMRPELLINDNQYFCENCQSKQNAQRGCRISKIPQVFTIQLNRFTYNYMIDKRVKLNGLFEFPYILNMNQFSNGFEQIPQQLIDGFENKKTQAEQIKQQQQNELKLQDELKNQQENQTQPINKKLTTNENQKESMKAKKPDLKEFLKNERMKNKKTKTSNKDEVEIELFTDDAKGEKYILEVNEIQDQQQSNLIPPPPPPPPAPVLTNLMSSNIPPPPQINILDNQLNTNKNNINNNQSIPTAPSIQGILQIKPQPNEEDQKAKEEQLNNYLQYLNETYQQYIQETKEQINNYLQEGENVYELFSICMHSGGAYGGHYYAFIKSFEDNYWYKFNDSSVTYMELEDVLKRSIGGVDSSSGYMLFYRKYNQSKEYKFNEESIPQYLKNIIEEEEKLKEEANKIITFKYDIDMKNKQNKNDNINSIDNSNMEIESNNNNQYILQLCFSNEHNMSQQDLNENNLEIQKLENINQQLTIEGIQKLICLKYNITDYKRVLIFRKIITEEQILGQMLNVQNNKSLKELNITNDEILFIEIQQEDVIHQYKWIDKFEEISSIINIKYNIPTQEEELQTQFNQIISIDSRKSEEYLKNIMCSNLKIDPKLIVLRLDGPMGKEIKNMTQLIKEIHLFDRKVYLQYGIPCDQNQYRNKLYIAQPQSLFENNIFFLFEEVSDIITNRNWSLCKLKEEIREILKQKEIAQYTQLNQDFEIREKYQFKMRRLYKTGLLSEQFVSDKTEFAIEFKDNIVQDLEQDQYKLYIRILDSQKNILSNRFEIIIQKDSTLLSTACAIYFQDQTIDVKKMCAFLVKDIEHFQFSDMISEEWICLDNDMESITKALKVSNDGQLLIIKDIDLNLKLFDLSNYKEMVIQRGQNIRVNKIYQHKEKALKINYEQDIYIEEEDKIQSQQQQQQ